MEFIINKIDREISAAEIEQMEKLLPAEKLELYHTMKFHSGRMRLLIGNFMVRTTVAETLNCDPESVNFVYNNHGKPSLADYPGLHFNISHSGNYVIAAFHHSEIGIDIEMIKPRKSLLNIAKAFMSEAELKIFTDLPEEEHLNMFYRLWAAKESFIKNTGNGLAEGLQTVTIDFSDEPVKVYKNNLQLPDYHFYKLAIDPGYIAFICTIE